jgi:uncharacterized membrane protein YhhN
VTSATSVSVAVIAIVAMAILSAASTDRAPVGSRVAKMAASTAVLVLLVVHVEAWTTYAVLVAVALAASWIGDLALSFEGRTAFVAGLGSFACAHLAYIAAFASRGGLDGGWMAVAGAVMAVVGLVVLRWLAPHRPAALAVPLAAYVFIIGVMVTTAFGTLGTDPDPRIPIGAALFAASDILVARQQFVSRTVVNRLIGLPAYFVAQILLALSA